MLHSGSGGGVTGAAALPSGAATEANQATEIASLASIDAKLTSPIAVTGGGGGTEYTEAAAAAANPVGGMLMAVSISSPGAEVTSGQNVALRATPKGELYISSVIDQNLISLSDSVTSGSVVPSGSFLMGFKSGTSQWARCRMEADNADAIAVDTTGHLQILSHTIGFNGTSWDRIRSGVTNADNITPLTLGALATSAYNMVFDGTNWDRMRGDSTDGVLVNLGANNDVTVTGAVTVSGTVTANAGTNLNTSLLALDSTVAKDASLTTINTSINTLLKPANTLAAVTSLTQFNGVAIALNTGVRSAGTLRVTIATDDVVPASQSGTWNIGTVTTVTTVSTVSSVTAVGTITPGTAASSLGKAEDAGHTTGDVGVMALAVRNDTPAALAGTTADYIPLTTNKEGALWQVPLPTATPTLSNVAASATSVTLLSANANRRQVVLVNDSTAICYVKFGTTASTTSYTVQMAGSASSQVSMLFIDENPIYTGRIDAIWASATGSMRVTEIVT